jgi:hypothetical protein
MTDKGMSADQIVGPKLFDGILKWNLVWRKWLWVKDLSLKI